MAFSLPNLPYLYSALEPYIDQETMKIHHTKHHQAYVDNLNKAVNSYPEFLKRDIEDILKNIKQVPGDVRQQVINHGGGHANHSFFWKILRPSEALREGGTSPKEKFLAAINSTFGNLDHFKEAFSQRAMGVFGSGWAWLLLTPDKKLILKRHSFQNSPLMQGNTPILGIDVWEHAYYLKYQNRRAEYLEAWWNVVNWEEVENIFNQSLL